MTSTTCPRQKGAHLSKGAHLRFRKSRQEHTGIGDVTQFAAEATGNKQQANRQTEATMQKSDLATLLSLPQKRKEKNGSKHADFTQTNERQDHFAAVTF